MHFMIATMKETCTDNPLTLDIEKSGNKFIVCLSNMAHQYTSRTFDSLTDAYKVFEKLSSWLIFGYYSEADRRKYLETGTMD